MYYQSKRKISATGISLMMYLGFIVTYVTVATAGGCSVSPERFRVAMDGEGFTDAARGDYDFFECGTGDVWGSHFDARRDGKSVAGTVCCGILKGCTTRWQ